MGQPAELKDRIRRARERVGWTQEQLAEAVGVNPKTVRNWESGTHPRRSLGAIEQHLGLRSGRLTDDSDDGDGDGDPLAGVTNRQLLQTLGARLDERDRQIEQLNLELQRLRADPSTAEGRWAARVRDES